MLIREYEGIAERLSKMGVNGDELMLAIRRNALDAALDTSPTCLVVDNPITEKQTRFYPARKTDDGKVVWISSCDPDAFTMSVIGRWLEIDNPS